MRKFITLYGLQMAFMVLKGLEDCESYEKCKPVKEAIESHPYWKYGIDEAKKKGLIRTTTWTFGTMHTEPEDLHILQSPWELNKIPAGHVHLLSNIEKYLKDLHFTEQEIEFIIGNACSDALERKIFD